MTAPSGHHSDPSRPRKLCFVTIGATASFDALVSASLSPSFLDALAAAGYTDLLVQYGTEGRRILEAFVADAERSGQHGVAVSGFDFNRQGLGTEMRAAKGGNGAVEGVVVSHAGELAGVCGAWCRIGAC